MHALIDEAARIASFELIAFTGGECFLLGSDLDELIGHASSNGFRTRTITNGYWAVNDRAARNRVAALREMGLREMMLSTGSFHQRFVPLTRVTTAARAAAEAGVVVRISVETCDQSTFDGAMLRVELADLIALEKVFIGDDPWITDAGGRGSADLTHRRLLESEPYRADGRCAQILNVVSVTPAQDLIACCGYPQEELPRLRLGSVAERSLGDVLASAPPELLKLWLHVAGPMAIARFVARHEPTYRPPRVASICEACIAVQRDTTAMRVFADHAAEALSEIAAVLAASDGMPAVAYAP